MYLRLSCIFSILNLFSIIFLTILFLCVNSCPDDSDDEQSIPPGELTPLPTITFFKTFGGTYDDYGYQVLQTNDEGFIVMGTTEAPVKDENDVILIKTDRYGLEQWREVFGESPRHEYGGGVTQTIDGCYVVTGWRWRDIRRDIFVTKRDENGKEIWFRIFDKKEVGEECHFISQTADGGFILCGESHRYGLGEIFILKLDENGEIDWLRHFDKPYYYTFEIQQTLDTGYIFCSITSDYRACLTKTDNNGNVVWMHIYDDLHWAQSVQQTADGGYILCGSTNYIGAQENDIFLLKTDNQGNVTWQKTYGGDMWDYGGAVRQTSDGGYILCGTINAIYGTNGDFYLLKTDADGNKVWSRSFGGQRSEGGAAVEQTTDGGYVVCGSTESYGGPYSRIMMLKTSQKGTIRKLLQE